MSGRITEEDFIRITRSSERDLATAYFHIGLSKLVIGDRKGALESLDKSASSLQFSYTNVKWSRAFAERLKKDPDWPDWLPAETSSIQTE